MTNYDVIVVGSGVIGLSLAWRLGSEGCHVALVDPHPGRGASHVAAGMLAPVTEAAWGEERLVEINVRAAESWPEFAATIEADAGLPVGLRRTGALLVGTDASDRAVLEELFEFQRHLGLEVNWCPPTRLRELEPLLAPGVRGGIFAPGDHQVDNRRLLGALAIAAERRGVETRRSRAERFVFTGGCVTGVETGDGELAAPVVVLAAGHSSPSIDGLPEELRPPVRPVKGQILRLRTPDGAPLAERTVRGIVGGRSVYIVPREDGGVVIGATVEELGPDANPTANGCYELLRDAIGVLPAVSELELVEIRAGLRPGSPDNAPLVGHSGVDGLLYATGHYRNGILLAPLTASLLVELLATGELPDWALPFTPQRLLPAAAGAVGS